MCRLLIRMGMKYFILFLFVIVFQGCFSTTYTVNRSNYQSKTNYIKQQKTPHIQNDSSSLYDIEEQTVKNAKKSNKKIAVYSGSIKGIVKSIVYDKSKKSWKYYIKGIDTSYGKLPYAKFYHDKKLAAKGDLVYVILDNSNLKNLFFIKKANIVPKKTKTYKKVTKRVNIEQKKYIGRKKMIFSVPTVENITF